MHTHPEQTENEVYLGNFTAAEGVPTYLAGLPSMRLGETAYDIDGNKLAASVGLLPLFVTRGPDYEAYDRIMTDRFKQIRGN